MAGPDADDMLAQLAGDEIDRLLAEAEANSTPPPAPAAPKDLPKSQPAPEPAASNPQASGVESLSANLDAILNAADTAANEPAPPSADAQPAIDSGGNPRDRIAGLSTNLDEVRTNAEAQKSNDGAEAATTPQTPATTVTQDGGTAVAPTAAPPHDPAAPATPEKTASVLPSPDASDADAGRVQFYIRILDFLLDPLESIPDGVRNAIGKVAIVTLVNAIGVIVYVVVFRRHHHK